MYMFGLDFILSLLGFMGIDLKFTPTTRGFDELCVSSFGPSNSNTVYSRIEFQAPDILTNPSTFNSNSTYNRIEFQVPYTLTNPPDSDGSIINPRDFNTTSTNLIEISDSENDNSIINRNLIEISDSESNGSNKSVIEISDSENFGSTTHVADPNTIRPTRFTRTVNRPLYRVRPATTTFNPLPPITPVTQGSNILPVANNINFPVRGASNTFPSFTNDNSSLNLAAQPPVAPIVQNNIPEIQGDIPNYRLAPIMLGPRERQVPLAPFNLYNYSLNMGNRPSYNQPVINNTSFNTTHPPVAHNVPLPYRIPNPIVPNPVVPNPVVPNIPLEPRIRAPGYNVPYNSRQGLGSAA